ncbi:MAG: IS21 family transposase [Pseudomonadales bacterium]|nr:IS21 family transposase [Pseudomonadales bacterium]
MIHKIKAMYDEGRGSSIKEIERALGVSRNTIRKYLRMDEQEVERTLSDRQRYKVLDEYRSYLKSLLSRYGDLKTPKVYRKLKAKVPELDVSERTLRRYLQQLRPLVASTQRRHYQPVIDDVPGVQCQVDGGELREVNIGGVQRTVYFLVFVLSYSRLMYVSLSPRPIDTTTFIHMHDAAFRYFGGIPEECVYDQTKLVVIKEEFREVALNHRFHQYASSVGLEVRVCAGYDPESKGKVEAGVKFVKGDCLYGDLYRDWSALADHVQTWLDEVANCRTHGTTGLVPRVHYDEQERCAMGPYLAAKLPAEQQTRKVDKTGLISYAANKYSVPMAYQQRTVQVTTADHELEPRHCYQYFEANGERVIARRTIEVLRHMCTIAVQWGLLKRNPIKGELRLKTPKPRQRYVTDEELVNSH